MQLLSTLTPWVCGLYALLWPTGMEELHEFGTVYDSDSAMHASGSHSGHYRPCPCRLLPSVLWERTSRRARMHSAASFSTLNDSSHSSRSLRSAYAASVASRCGPKPGTPASAQAHTLQGVNQGRLDSPMRSFSTQVL